MRRRRTRGGTKATTFSLRGSAGVALSEQAVWRVIVRRGILRCMTVYETTNHNTIYHWSTSRGLWPACVAGSPDRIRLGGDEFAAETEELEPVEWWRWFQEFDRRQLQLVYDPSKGWFTLGSRLPPTGA
jgi:hypothetical protein